MPRAFYVSDLSVDPPSKEISVEGIYKIPFQSDSAATSAAVRMTDLSSMASVSGAGLSISAVASDIATVTVDADALNLERGKAYELSVDFSDSDETWTGVLVLVVVA